MAKQVLGKVQAIIPAAGMGTRFKAAKDKPLVLLKGKPLIYFTLLAFERCPQVHSVIVVVKKTSVAEFGRLIKRFAFKKVVRVIPGGQQRHDSVRCGLAQIDADTRWVIVHDGARPLVSPALITTTVLACQRYRAVVAAVPVKSTIKVVDAQRQVKATLARDTLWEIQTPQIFDKNILVRAHVHNRHPNPTDDAMMVEALGVKVTVVPSAYSNIKVTTPEDLDMAKVLLGK